MTRLDDYLDRFGEDLSTAAATAPSPRRPRRRWIAAGAIAVAGAVTAVVVLAVAPSGSKLDAVARAQQALTPSDGIVHLVVTSWTDPPGNAKAAPATTTETWSAGDPTRWRLVQDIPDDGSNGYTVDDDGERVTGRIEQAYAHGDMSLYFAQPDKLRIVTDQAPAGMTMGAPTFFSPVLQVRSLLTAGQLRDDGIAEVEGRALRKLVQDSGGDAGNGGSYRRTATYYVDPDTYAPVSGTLQMDITSATPQGTPHRLPSLVVHFRVDTYDVLPDDEEHATLLTIPTTPSTQVTRLTRDEMMTRQQESLRKAAERQKQEVEDRAKARGETVTWGTDATGSRTTSATMVLTTPAETPTVATTVPAATTAVPTTATATATVPTTATTTTTAAVTTP